VPSISVANPALATDAYRAKLLALPAAIAAASPARREELCRIVVEQVVVNDRNVKAIVGTLPARLVPPRGLEDPPAV
jgi:glucose-6-phosphate dehydrogenase assembly protein OpcA